MAWNKGKTAILRDTDKILVDRIVQGEDSRQVFEELFPDKVKGRTEKHIRKSISDILKKPKVKEYKESLEAKVEEALNNSIQVKADAIANTIMEEEELMALYSEIARDNEESTMCRLRALDSLSRYLYGLDKKKVEVDADIQQQIIFSEEGFNEEED